jgi:type II secretory pathway component PulC
MIIDVMIAVVTRVFSFVVTIINRQQPTTTKHDTRKETNKKNFIKLTCTYLRVKQATNKTTPQK